MCKKVFLNLIFSIFAIVFMIGKAVFAQQNKSSFSVNYTINESWKFSKVDSNENYKATFSDVDWKSVTIPHTWNNEDAVDETPGYYRGACWYRRNFIIGKEALDKKVFINFEGANQEVFLYVNEKYIGKHIGGYSAFNFDITPYIIIGKSNLIAIKVDNSYNKNIPPLTADFTFFGGIYRDVFLSFLPLTHIAVTDFSSSGIYISTPKVSENQAEVTIKTIITNSENISKSIFLIQKVIAPNGEVVVQKTTKIKLAAHQDNTINNKPIVIDLPELWSPDSPNLYKLITILVDGISKKNIQETQNTFGIRWFEFNADKGFFINGKPTKLIGASRHEIFEGIGNGLRDEYHVRDVKLLKDMGANFLRVSHYPQDPFILSLCDQLGILATVEIPIVNEITETDEFLDNSLQMTNEMVKQNFNHPSLVSWAYMNEVLLRPPFKNDPARHKVYCSEVQKQAKAIEKRIRELDPYRYTMIPCNSSLSAYKEAGLLEIPKLIGWNLYQGWYSGAFIGFDDFLDKFHAEFPKTPMIVSEYGADVDLRLHSFSSERFDFTVEYGNRFQEHYLNSILKRDFVSGAAIWNLNDFYSEKRGNSVPHVNNKGITSLNRELKDTYLLYQAHLLKKPFLAFGSKNWKTRSGLENGNKSSEQPISIYTNLAKLELQQNGKKIGEFYPVDGVVNTTVPFINGDNLLHVIGIAEGNWIEDFYSTHFTLIPSLINNSNFSELSVMLGSNRYFEDKEGQICWIPEKEYFPGSWGYVGGTPFKVKTRYGELPASDLDILGTNQDPIFQTQRIGLESFKADVPNGSYAVYLYWADLFPTKTKEELVYNLGNSTLTQEVIPYVFNVSMNNDLILQDFDISNQIGAEKAIVKKIQVEVTNNKGIELKLEPKLVGKTYLNAIRIVKLY